MFNTLIPQDHPGNFRHFVLPWKHLDPTVCVRLDHDGSLGIADRGGPLVDPTQDIFIVEFRIHGGRVFLILRTQLVIGYVCSKPEDTGMSGGETLWLWISQSVAPVRSPPFTVPMVIGCERPLPYDSQMRMVMGD